MSAPGAVPISLGGLWRLARPAGMPLVLALPLVGFGFAHWEWGLELRNPEGLAWTLAAWWFLSAGTLWLNAALDEDDGEVLMGPTEAVPEGLAGWGYGALAASVCFGGLAGWGPGLCCLGAAVMAVLYSHPSVAWKGHPVAGPAINILGYGVLSPVAGWLLVGSEPTVRTLPALALLVCWIAATYFGAQAFQRREDAARGYRTFVVTHGPAATVRLARLLYRIAYGGALVYAALGWLPRLLWGSLPLFVYLDQHMGRWLRDADQAGAAYGRQMLVRGTYLALSVMVMVTLHHGWQAYTRGPPAGLGTAWRPTP